MSKYLVTGGTGGIGGVVVQRLLALDHQVMLTMRDPDAARPLGTAFVVADLWGWDPGPTARMVKHVAETFGGPIDGIFHGAGEAPVRPLAAHRDEYAQAMWAATSAYGLLVAASQRDIVAAGARIVLMSSVAAHRGVAGMVAYSAAKASIEGMVRSAAIELSPRGVLVNAVAAGGFRSAMHDRITKKMPQAAIDNYARAHPLGIGSQEQVAQAVMPLLLDTNTWQTGSVVVCDGGFLAG